MTEETEQNRRTEEQNKTTRERREIKTEREMEKKLKGDKIQYEIN